jgi:hypothetical protein
LARGSKQCFPSGGPGAEFCRGGVFPWNGAE